MKSKILVLFICLFTTPPVNAKKTKRINVDISPQIGFSLESNLYQEGVFYSPTISNTIKEFSFGINAQNISTFDTQDSVYGSIIWNHKVIDDFSLFIGTMVGSNIHEFQLDTYSYSGINYDFDNTFSVVIGPALEDKHVLLSLGITKTIDKLQIVTNYISGNKNMSGYGMNVGYQINKNFQPYIGYGNSGESYMTLGFNYSI